MQAIISFINSAIQALKYVTGLLQSAYRFYRSLVHRHEEEPAAPSAPATI